MAGFQQAANALTGSVGTVGGRVGVYNELVGKNKELIKKTQAQNEELTKKNEELDKKNEQLGKKNKELRSTNEMLNQSINMNSMMAQDYVRMGRMAGRIEAHERAIESRDRMLDIVYGEKPVTTAGPTGPKY